MIGLSTCDSMCTAIWLVNSRVTPCFHQNHRPIQTCGCHVYGKRDWLIHVRRHVYRHMIGCDSMSGSTFITAIWLANSHRSLLDVGNTGLVLHSPHVKKSLQRHPSQEKNSSQDKRSGRPDVHCFHPTRKYMNICGYAIMRIKSSRAIHTEKKPRGVVENL